MFWYTKVNTRDNGSFYCTVRASSEQQACFLARKYYRQEGEQVESSDAEMFNNFEHGDPNDYYILD